MNKKNAGILGIGVILIAGAGILIKEYTQKKQNVTAYEQVHTANILKEEINKTKKNTLFVVYNPECSQCIEFKSIMDNHHPEEFIIKYLDYNTPEGRKISRDLNDEYNFTETPSLIWTLTGKNIRNENYVSFKLKDQEKYNEHLSNEVIDETINNILKTIEIINK